MAGHGDDDYVYAKGKQMPSTDIDGKPILILSQEEARWLVTYISEVSVFTTLREKYLNITELQRDRQTQLSIMRKAEACLG